MEDKNQTEQKEYHFITEKRKKRPMDKRKALGRLLNTVAMAILFGFVSCFVFVLSMPHFESFIQEDDPPTITIPRDTYEELEKNYTSGETPGEKSEQNDSTSSDSADSKKDSSPDDDTESQKEKNQKQKTVYLTEIQSMGIEGYEQLQKEIFKIGSDAEKSLVIVTGVSKDIDVFEKSYENRGSISGIIIANTGTELLILTEKSILEDASQIHVTFLDNTTADAQLKKTDNSTGLAVLGVSLSEIEKETLEEIETAALGNSYLTSQGDLMIAVGTSSGEQHILSMGVATSVKDIFSSPDKDYTIIRTNITGLGKENGFLMNSSGEIIGLILPGFFSSETESVMALSISECKGIIERLSNNKSISYFGIYGTNITEAVAKEHDFPVTHGVYVMSSIADSPGMNAGIQKGDLITDIDDEEIHSMQEFSEYIHSHDKGDVLHVTLQRLGREEYKEMEFDVTLEDQPQ